MVLDLVAVDVGDRSPRQGGQPFVVAGQPTVSDQPAETSLHHPAAGQDLEALTSSVRFTISTTMSNASRAHESRAESTELAYPPSAHARLIVRKPAASWARMAWPLGERA
ncbi:hypothetical protein [Streptomyces lydicamycinicus]|jgi:hypothetical protein|uniref:hypothetical protein n=1 Tax=Streptomyces lydicamycinicus TaxID=1546107 RepID=UPI003D806369